MRILLIEDDSLFGSSIKDFLAEEDGYTVDWVNEGNAAYEVTQTNEHFDLVILDLEVPQFDWQIWLKKFREQNKRIPVLVLSANNNMTDTLDAGANQYLAKSYFKIEKLSSIIRSLLRHSDIQSTSNIISFKEITMNLSTREVLRDKVKISLSRRQFDLLHKLLKQVNTIVTRDHLTQSIYSWDTVISSNTLDVHISQLRWKLFNCDLRLVSNKTSLDEFILRISQRKEIIVVKSNDIYQIYFKSKSGKVQHEVISKDSKKLYALINRYDNKFDGDGTLLNKNDNQSILLRSIYKFVNGSKGYTTLTIDYIKTIRGIGYSISDQ